VRIFDNRHRFFAGSRVTGGRSGSFEIERKIVDRRGVDRITAVARNPRTGERCVAALRYVGSAVR
jgi:hypothetical protein